MTRAVATLLLLTVLVTVPALSPAQGPGGAGAAGSAFEAGRWREAIAAYRALLSEDRLNGVYWLRIAQAQRELGEHANALDTLARARVAQAPEAMLELERARNLAVLGRIEPAYRALVAADEAGLRSLSLLNEAEELHVLRADERFQRLHRSVRRRVYPCESIPATRDFDFWVGTWDVRLADGTLIGRSTVSKQDGGCAVLEDWEGGGGSAGTSMAFFVPSRGQWRQVWAGSGGTLIDLTGGLEDGVMRMEGTIEYAGLANSLVAFRGTWTQLPDGRVRQLYEEFDVGRNAWQVWFEGFYALAADP